MKAMYEFWNSPRTKIHKNYHMTKHTDIPRRLILLHIGFNDILTNGSVTGQGAKAGERKRATINNTFPWDISWIFLFYISEEMNDIFVFVLVGEQVVQFSLFWRIAVALWDFPSDRQITCHGRRKYIRLFVFFLGFLHCLYVCARFLGPEVNFSFGFVWLSTT